MGSIVIPANRTATIDSMRRTEHDSRRSIPGNPTVSAMIQVVVRTEEQPNAIADPRTLQALPQRRSGARPGGAGFGTGNVWFAGSERGRQVHADAYAGIAAGSRYWLRHSRRHRRSARADAAAQS